MRIQTSKGLLTLLLVVLAPGSIVLTASYGGDGEICGEGSSTTTTVVQEAPPEPIVFLRRVVNMSEYLLIRRVVPVVPFALIRQGDMTRRVELNTTDFRRAIVNVTGGLIRVKTTNGAQCVSPECSLSFQQAGSTVAPTVIYKIQNETSIVEFGNRTVPFMISMKNFDRIIYDYQETVAGAAGVQYVTDVNSVTVCPLGGQCYSPPELGWDTATESETITGNYRTQYLVSLYWSGVGSDSGPFKLDDWWVYSGDTTSYDFNATLQVSSDERYLWTSTEVNGQLSTSQSSSITVSAPVNITGNYNRAQFLVAFASSQIGNDTGTNKILTVDSVDYSQATPLHIAWYDSGASVSYAFASPIADGSGKRYVWTSTSGLDQSGQLNTFTVAQGGTITGVYKTQYQVKFTSFGIGNDNQGSTLTVNSASYSNSSLPYVTWYDNNTQVTYAYASPVGTSDPLTRYVWTSTTGLQTDQSGTFTVTHAGTIQGNYLTQHRVTFAASGIDDDTGTNPIVTVNGTGYARNQLPFTVWYDRGVSISYAYAQYVDASPASGKRYVCRSVTGIHTGQSGTFTVTQGGAVTGYYDIQYYLAVASAHGSPTVASGWFDAGAALAVQVTSPADESGGTRYRCSGWTGTGSVPAAGTVTLVNLVVNEPSSITWNWVTQHLLTINVDPSWVPSTFLTGGAAGWYDAASQVPLQAAVGPFVGADKYPYFFLYWDVDGAKSVPVTMDAPHTATAHYVTPMRLTGPILDSGPTSVPRGTAGSWTFHYTVTANVDLTSVTVQGGFASRVRVLSICVDGVCKTPTSGTTTATFTWSAMAAGTSHTIVIKASSSLRGAVPLTTQWSGACTSQFGTTVTPNTAILVVMVN